MKTGRIKVAGAATVGVAFAALAVGPANAAGTDAAPLEGKLPQVGKGNTGLANPQDAVGTTTSTLGKATKLLGAPLGVTGQQSRDGGAHGPTSQVGDVVDGAAQNLHQLPAKAVPSQQRAGQGVGDTLNGATSQVTGSLPTGGLPLGGR